MLRYSGLIALVLALAQLSGSFLRSAAAEGGGPLQLQQFLNEGQATSVPGSNILHYRYVSGLEEARLRYRDIAAAGGWGEIDQGEVLKVGSNDPRVPALRRRLAVSGEYRGTYSAIEVFDADLERAITRFQLRNGLEPDGIVGPKTLATLNISPERRMRQIGINIERWRQLSADLGDRFVLVNLAAFELEVIENNAVQLDMRIIVGRNYRQSPSFSDRIRYIEFNPYWNVPTSIARKDLLPKFINDPGYAVSNGYEAIQNGTLLDIASIDWSSYAGSNLPFNLRQKPGPLNALGEMKFMFPNSFNVYLHDTPARELFGETVRTFSSGCIRLERPLELALYLLGENADWPVSRVLRVLDNKSTEQAHLSAPVPVHLVYMTAWVDPTGTVQFRPDIYGRDEEFARTMFTQ